MKLYKKEVFRKKLRLFKIKMTSYYLYSINVEAAILIEEIVNTIPIILVNLQVDSLTDKIIKILCFYRGKSGKCFSLRSDKKLFQ